MPLRKGLGRARRAAIEALGGVVPTPGDGTGSPSGLSLDDLVELLYPGVDPGPLRAQVEGLVGSGPFRAGHDLRRVLGAVDRQEAPSPVSIRFGSDAVRPCQVGGITLYLDADDRSVSRPILDGHPYEPHVEAVFRRLCQPGMTVVDVGANVGYYSVLGATLVGPAGRVVAVEANSENCRLIALSLRANKCDNVEIWPVALDEQRGWAYFSTHVGSNGGLISDRTGDLVDGRGVVVPTFSLDELMTGPVHLIKLDVEGAEGRVVAGARRTIAEHRPVVVTELSLEMLNRVSAVDGAEYLGWFEGLGYTMQVMNRGSHLLDPPTTGEALLASWGDPLRIEDVLLLPGPADRQVEAPVSR